MPKESIRNLAVHAARTAGEILQQMQGTRLKTQHKENLSANAVSEADFAANECVLSLIQKEFPSHAILSEEESEEHNRAALKRSESDYCWIIDPLDGTNNYLHGLSQYSVSIAVLQNQKPMLGVVYQPNYDRLFLAEAGGGAWENEKRIHCSSAKQLNEALIGVGFYYDRDKSMRATLRCIEKLFGKDIHGIRRFGCASLDLCYVASGRLDAFFEFTLSPWDFAAAALIVEEAGGRISTADKQPLPIASSSVFASNPLLYDETQAIIEEEFNSIAAGS